jgi:hypothetical protein
MKRDKPTGTVIVFPCIRNAPYARLLNCWTSDDDQKPAPISTWYQKLSPRCAAEVVGIKERVWLRPVLREERKEAAEMVEHIAGWIK